MVTTALTSRAEGQDLSKWCILLDSEVNVDMICNRQLLSGIKDARGDLNVRCNVGNTKITKRGYLANYGWVWYDEISIAGILSLSRASDHPDYHIIYNN